MNFDYWLGVITIPVVAGIGWVMFWTWILTTEWLYRHGITFAIKVTRHVSQISDYTLRHDIWWERRLGPFFAGGWHRGHGGRALFTRWIGLGRVDGPCFMAFWKREA